MDKKIVGQFIRQLRKERGMSQYELADKLMIPRVSISKWERGYMTVTPKYLKLLSEFFDVTVDELMVGERRDKGLADKINEAMLKILDNNIKLHRIIKYSVAVIILLVVSFLLHYFYTFYNSVKIYTIHLDSDKYIANYGQLVKTMDKIYFYLDIDYLVDEIEDIESVQLFYTSGSNLVVLGEQTNIQPFSFTSYCGYDEYIKFDDFDVALNSMYIYVNFVDGSYESFRVEFDRDYVNSKVFLKSNKSVDETVTTKSKWKESTKVYDRFLEVKDIIEKHGNDNVMSFDFEDKLYELIVIDDEFLVTTSINEEKYSFRYSYQNKEMFYLIHYDNEDMENQIYSFDIQMGKCLEGDCTNHMDNYRELVRIINELIYEY